MRFGFTGTRQGMTDAQQREFVGRVAELIGESGLPWGGIDGHYFYHGCCVGADEDAVRLLLEHFTGHALNGIRGHPPTLDVLVSRFAALNSSGLEDPKPYLDRNRTIVDYCQVLIACPGGMTEERRSGTWATVRYARGAGRPRVILWPDGTATEEQADALDVVTWGESLAARAAPRPPAASTKTPRGA